MDDGKIMPPVVDRPRQLVVATFNNPRVFAKDTALGRNDQSVWINPQAYGPVRKRRRHAVAITGQGGGKVYQ